MVAISPQKAKPNRKTGVSTGSPRTSRQPMYQPIDYFAAVLVAIMILGPLSAGQSHVSHSSVSPGVTQQQ